MPFGHSLTPVESLRLFLAHYHGLDERHVRLRGLVPGEDPYGYAQLVSDAMSRAWTERGNRPLPPDYEPPRNS